MKLTLSSLELKNFRSVAEAKLEFDANGMVLLQGASGAGKSTINLAIAYALGFCNVPQTQLQRWDTKEMSVRLEFLLDGEKVWVHRGTDFVGCAGPGEFSALNGAKNANARLLTLLKITPDMLGSLTYRPQQEPGAFIRKTDAEKKEFLTQILRLDQFEKAIDDSNARIKKLQGDLGLAARDIEHLTLAVADAERALVTPPSALEIQQAEASIAETRSRLAENRSRLAELERVSPEVAEKKALQAEANSLLDKAIAEDERRATAFQLELRASRDAAAAYRTKHTKAEGVAEQLKQLERQQAQLLDGTCPTCGQNTPAGEGAGKLSLQIQALKARYAPLTGEEMADWTACEEAATSQFQPSPKIEKLRKIATKFHGQVQAALEQNRGAIQQLYREEHEGKASIEQLSRYLTAAKTALAHADRALAHKKSKEEALAGAQKRFEALEQDLAAEEDFVSLVGNQGFLGAIFEEVLQDISLDANEILGRIPNTSAVTIEFKTESVTQKGVVKRSIVPVVSVGGHVGPFDSSLSGGMKTMVSLAVDLAVSKVIARRAGIQPGWLILDEPADGMDSQSREAMYELMAKESEARLVIVIDHATDTRGLFSKVITATSNNGSTTYAG